MAHVHGCAEVIRNRRVLRQPPVVKQPGDIAVDPRRVGFVNDERSGQPTSDLLETALVGVIPEGPGIDRVELVGEGFSGCDRLLRQVWNPVHRVRQTKSVPMDGGFLVQTVCDGDAQPIALPSP